MDMTDVLTAVGCAFAFFVWTKVEIAKLQKDVEWHKNTYRRDRENDKEHKNRLYRNDEKILSAINQLQIDVKVVKQMSGVNGKH